MILAAIALVAVLGVAAAVMARSTTSGNAQTITSHAGPTAPGARAARHRNARAVRIRVSSRTLGRESAQINATLRYTPFVAAGSGRRRAMALTFDDGPSPYTTAIVHILVRMHVPATFFVVGQQLPVFPDAFRDELKHGFEIGDHTENHAWLVRLSAGGQYGQIHADAVAAERLGAPPPRLFRPPYGAYDRVTIAILHRLRMLMVLWSIDPDDWLRPGAKAIVARVLSHARPGRIVILHDGGGDRSQTVAALPAIVRGLRRRGYRLVSVPALIALDPPPRHQQLPRVGVA